MTASEIRTGDPTREQVLGWIDDMASHIGGVLADFVDDECSRQDLEDQLAELRGLLTKLDEVSK